MVMEVNAPPSPVLSSVVRVAEVQALLEQWATLRLRLLTSW